MTRICDSFVKLVSISSSWVIKQLFQIFLCNSQIITPSALGNSSSGHPQYLGVVVFDCCTERYEIVVYCEKSAGQSKTMRFYLRTANTPIILHL